MDFKVLIADSAIADLKEIVQFAAQHNPDAALRLGEKLVDRFPSHDRGRGIRKWSSGPF
ncbi:MAG: type II toxin-antitoxin system RelE/ParE family toxin [Candidatus Udaeobacter sp.]